MQLYHISHIFTHTVTKVYKLFTFACSNFDLSVCKKVTLRYKGGTPSVTFGDSPLCGRGLS